MYINKRHIETLKTLILEKTIFSIVISHYPDLIKFFKLLDEYGVCWGPGVKASNFIDKIPEEDFSSYIFFLGIHKEPNNIDSYLVNALSRLNYEKCRDRIFLDRIPTLDFWSNGLAEWSDDMLDQHSNSGISNDKLLDDISKLDNIFETL